MSAGGRCTHLCIALWVSLSASGLEEDEEAGGRTEKGPGANSGEICTAAASIYQPCFLNLNIQFWNQVIIQNRRSKFVVKAETGG